jgi:hypothetical protein
MIPGLTTKISEAVVSLETTINPKSDLLRITSTTSTTVMSTVIPHFSGQSGMMIVVNQSGATVTTVTTGNILTAVSIANAASVVFVYSKMTDKWIVGALL